MYAKKFELYKLKRIISENYGRTRIIGANAFHVRSKKNFLISLDVKIKSQVSLIIFSYPIEYCIRMHQDSTVRDILEKLITRDFLELKRIKSNRAKVRSPLGITNNSKGKSSKKVSK